MRLKQRGGGYTPRIEQGHDKMECTPWIFFVTLRGKTCRLLIIAFPERWLTIQWDESIAG